MNDKPDMVAHPPHYKANASGVECITVTRRMTFCLGNAFKYLYRRNEKHASAETDMKKALWYLEDERENGAGVPLADFNADELVNVSAIANAEDDLLIADVMRSIGTYCMWGDLQDLNDAINVLRIAVSRV